MEIPEGVVTVLKAVLQPETVKSDESIGMCSRSKGSKSNSTTCVVDAGANKSIFNSPSVFSSINRCSKVKILAADSYVSGHAHVGVLKPNSLGLVNGLFHPGVNENLLSKNDLTEVGNSLTFSPSRDWLTRADESEIEIVSGIGGLPVLSVEFFEEEEFCANVSEADDVVRPVVYRASAAQRLQHVRNGHFGSIDFPCPSCIMGKGVVKGHKSERPQHLKPVKYLQQADFDFVGKFRTSISGATQIMTAVETYHKWVHIRPCVSRSESGKCLKEFVERVGKPTQVRSDNAKEFKEAGCSWRKMAKLLGVAVTFSPPYTPAMNGKCERVNRVLGEFLRCNLLGVDKSLWCFCAKFFEHLYNRREAKDGKSPYERVKGVKPSKSYYRRFGCLCYYRIHTHLPKLDPKWRPAVFVGYGSESSVWRCGTFKDGNFKVVESRSVKFDEEVLVGDIQKLNCQEFTDRSLEDMFESTQSDLVVEADSRSTSASSGGVTIGDLTGSDADAEMVDIGEDLEDKSSKKIESSKILEIDRKSTKIADNILGTNRKVDILNSNSSSGSNSNIGSNGSIVCEGGVTKKKRGRPPGTRNKEGSKKPGPKVGSKRSKKLVEVDVKCVRCNVARAAVDDEVKQCDNQCGNGSSDSCEFDVDELEDGEVVISWTVQVSHREAFDGPGALKWIEAESKERLALETMGCWRPIEDGEIREGDEIIPSALLLTRKRCGKYKARLVALGNRQRAVNALDVFSPTISHAANRAFLIRSADRQAHIETFDISNAFIQAELKSQRVFVRLPKRWSVNQERGDIVRLLRSLYGLRIAPRSWYDCYSSYLLSIGFEKCDREPGLFRYPALEIEMSIFVDDSTLAAPSALTASKMREKILAHFSGRIVNPVSVSADGTEEYDILGVQVYYNRLKRMVKFSLANAIDKAVQKFQMGNCKAVSTPIAPGVSFVDEGENSDTAFPFRECLGVLSYIATLCRPDVLFAVNKVARSGHTCKSVEGLKRVIRYLSATKHYCIEFSPQKFEEFKKVYKNYLGDVSDLEWVCFCDADFAGCEQSSKSTSGSAVYYRGVLVGWRSKLQTTRSHSTCEAEYVSLYDGIRLCQSYGFLDWWMPDSELPVVCTDNKSSLDLSGAALVTRKSKHINLRYHTVRDYKEFLCWVPSALNLADSLTKAVTPAVYKLLFSLRSFLESGKCAVL